MLTWFLQTQFIFLMNINETFYNLRKGVTGLKFSDVMPELEEANHFVVSLEEFNRTISKQHLELSPLLPAVWSSTNALQ